MSDPRDLDRSLRAWLADEFPPSAPGDLLPEALAAAAGTPRRPGWRIPERWIPMRVSAQLAVIPRAAIVLVTLLVLTALVAGAVVVGSQPAPVGGPPANGLIAFGTGGDIWVVEPDLTGRRRLTTDSGTEAHAIWSPDGGQVAYWTFDQPTDGSPLAADLAVMNADGTSHRIGAEGVVINDSACPVSWSPDGLRIAYADARDTLGAVFVVPAASGAPVALVTHAECPAWSPDGRTIAYRVPSPVGGGQALRLFGSDGSGDRALSTELGSGEAFIPTWSPDGQRLAYLSGDDGFHALEIAALDGSDHVTYRELGDIMYAAWSPDGRTIAVSRTAPGSTWQGLQFVLVDPATGSATPLEHPLVFAWPTWSPDSTKLLGKVVTKGEPDFLSDEVVVVDVAGRSGPQTIPAASGQGMPTWQPVYR